jgi:tetratricopeptide (TPR) repeat protein
MATCEMVYQKCLDSGEVRQSLLLIGLGYSGLGRVAYFKDDFSGAEEAYRKAIYYLSQTGHKAAHINALSALGFIRFGLDEYSQALELLDEALKLGEGDTDPESLETRINIATYACAMLCFTGDIARSNALAVEMARESVRVNRSSARLQAHVMWAMTEYFYGNYQKALQICHDNHVLAGKLQVRFWISLMDVIEGMSYLALGNLDNSWKILEQVNNRLINNPTEKIAMQARKVRGDFYRLVGDWDKAKEQYWELIADPALNYITVECRYALGVMLAVEGNAEDGLHWLEESIRGADELHLTGTGFKGRIARAFLRATPDSINAFEKECCELLGRIREMGLKIFMSEELIAAYSAELRDETDRALGIYLAMLDDKKNFSNIWEDLYLTNRVLLLTEGSGATDKRVQSRLKELVNKLTITATVPAAKSGAQRVRKKLKGIGNVVSTP